VGYLLIVLLQLRLLLVLVLLEKDLMEGVALFLLLNVGSAGQVQLAIHILAFPPLLHEAILRRIE